MIISKISLPSFSHLALSEIISLFLFLDPSILEAPSLTFFPTWQNNSFYFCQNCSLFSMLFKILIVSCSLTTFFAVIFFYLNTMYSIFPYSFFRQSFSLFLHYILLSLSSFTFFSTSMSIFSQDPLLMLWKKGLFYIQNLSSPLASFSNYFSINNCSCFSIHSFSLYAWIDLNNVFEKYFFLSKYLLNMSIHSWVSK